MCGKQRGNQHGKKGTRGGLVISLMAMLELDRSQLLEWQQPALFAPVSVRLRGG